MTLPSIVPVGFSGTTADFTKAKVDRSGAARIVAGSVSVPSGTAADTFVGLFPFNKSARVQIGNSNVYCGDFGAGSTTVNLGYIYSDNVTYTNDVDAWASLSTAPQSGGFITVDEIQGMTFVAEADGWVAVQLKASAADATASITFQCVVAYDQ